MRLQYLPLRTGVPETNSSPRVVHGEDICKCIRNIDNIFYIFSFTLSHKRLAWMLPYEYHRLHIFIFRTQNFYIIILWCYNRRNSWASCCRILLNRESTSPILLCVCTRENRCTLPPTSHHTSCLSASGFTAEPAWPALSGWRDGMDVYAFKPVAGQPVPHELEQGDYFFRHLSLNTKPPRF